MVLTTSLSSQLLESLKSYDNQYIGLVYKIECLQNGRKYVGQTSGLCFQFLPNVRRFQEHRNALIRGVHKSKLLQADWDLYGEHSFTTEVIEIVPLQRFRYCSYPSRYKSLLLMKERYWQIWLDGVYNHPKLQISMIKI